MSLNTINRVKRRIHSTDMVEIIHKIKGRKIKKERRDTTLRYVRTYYVCNSALSTSALIHGD